MASSQTHTVKSLATRLDVVERIVSNFTPEIKGIHEQIAEIAKVIDAAEFPEEGDRGGVSIKQGFRQLHDDVKELSSKWDGVANVKEGVHECTKISDHVLFARIHQDRLEREDKWKSEVKELKDQTIRLKEELITNELEIDGCVVPEGNADETAVSD